MAGAEESAAPSPAPPSQLFLAKKQDSVKNSDHFDVLCVLIACIILEIINQMSKNQKSSLIVWNTVSLPCNSSLGNMRIPSLCFALYYIPVRLWLLPSEVHLSR